MEKLFFLKEIKDHESLWRIYHHQKSFFFLSVKGHALDPLKLISQNQAAFVSCDWSVSNE